MKWSPGKSLFQGLFRPNTFTRLLYLYKNWNTAHLNMKTQNKREGLSGGVKGYNAIEPWKGKSSSLLFHWIFNQSWPRFPLHSYLLVQPQFLCQVSSLMNIHWKVDGFMDWHVLSSQSFQNMINMNEGKLGKSHKKIEWVYTTWRVQSCTFKSGNPTETPINSVLQQLFNLTWCYWSHPSPSCLDDVLEL